MSEKIEKLNKLDDNDFLIIEALKKDSKLSEQKIAKKTGIPMTTVHNRIKKLREKGIIEFFTIRINYKKIGKPIVAYVHVKIIHGADQKKMLDEIAKIPEVSEVAMVTGEYDLIFKARVASMEELQEIVIKHLRKEKNVGETMTMIAYETLEKP